MHMMGEWTGNEGDIVFLSLTLKILDILCSPVQMPIWHDEGIPFSGSLICTQRRRSRWCVQQPRNCRLAQNPLHVWKVEALLHPAQIQY